MKVWKGIVVLVALVAINLLVSYMVWRWDMTDDKRYSISAPTKALLQDLDAPLTITLLLDGEMNAGFLRLQKATQEMVEELGVYAAGGYQLLGAPEQLTTNGYGNLEPTVVHERTHKGQTAQTIIYPYAIVQYHDRSQVVTLLKNQRGLSGEENLNHSIENLEFAFAEAIRSLTQDTIEKIAFLEGHGELEERDVYDLTQQLAKYYQIDRGTLGTVSGVLDEYKAVIIADPQMPFSETDKYILDQYIMQSGRILWVVNGVRFSDDYLASEGYTPIIALDLNINDMLFRYGVRINHALVQDLQCLPVPVDVSHDPNQPNWQPMPWTFAPLLLTSQVSPITRNVAQVTATMASAIDIVGEDDGIRKEVLLATSSASRLTSAPAKVDLSMGSDSEGFNQAFVPVAVSLEGVFPSIYAHLLPPEEVTLTTPLLRESKPTRQIVVAAGSTIRNDWQQGQPLPLGYDRYTQMQFGNRDFMVNAVLHLTDDQGWLQLRKKEFTLRLINDQRARQTRIVAQVISIVIPLALLAIVGGVMLILRRKRYVK
ncbi:MAG: gliding motility-associated ABC transporter substrate-binding protein GldG [Paludibacteraceae bacterium]|nr:gliding motility-associated ABC transporter substrate-binding protein GldG [Paludibacteraceae bacterium]